jgi:hypothetical protein
MNIFALCIGRVGHIPAVLIGAFDRAGSPAGSDLQIQDG